MSDFRNNENVLDENIIIPVSVLNDLSDGSASFYIRMLFHVQEGYDVFSSKEALVQFAVDAGIFKEQQNALPYVNELLESGYLKDVFADIGEEVYFTYGPSHNFERCVCGKLPQNYQEEECINAFCP